MHSRPAGVIDLASRRPLPRWEDDAALGRALRAGDPGAQAALFDRFAPTVRRLLRRALGPDDALDDLVQDCFLRLLQSIGRLETPDALPGFVVSVTLHTARSELRRRRVRRILRLTPTGAPPDGAPEAASAPARLALRRFYALLEELDADSRLAFVLRHVEELELTQVASHLGWSLATTKRKLARAQTRLEGLASSDPILCDYVRPARASEEAP